MKRFTKIVILLFLIPIFVDAQITVLSTDMPIVGDNILRTRDSVASNVNIGSGGANQVYNFSNVTSSYHTTSTTHVVSPSSTPDASSFSTSTQAFTVDNTNYAYATNSSSTYTGKGFAGNFAGQRLVVVYNPDYTQYTFPVTYNTHYTDNFSWQATVTGSSVNAPLYSNIRDYHTSTVKDSIDGWGTVTTPVGTYNCLRIHRIEYKRDSIEGQNIFPPTWSHISTTLATSVSYIYLTKETKLPVVEVSYDTAHNPIVIYTNIQATPTDVPFAENINEGLNIYPNPASDNINITVYQPNRDGKLFMKLYNTVGAVVYEKELKADQNINENISLTNFSQGIYYLELRGSNQEFFARKKVVMLGSGG